MMFRSLFFAPLLVAADVEEQSVLLQMKGRAETQVLMQRASEGISSETLRNLEMGLMAKGPKKVETAKCAYHMKTPKADYAEKTPCEVLDVLEELYEETFDHFEEFGKIADKAVNEIMKVTDSSLKKYPDVNLTASFEYNSTNLGLTDTKFHKAFVKAQDKKFGASMNETEIYGALRDHDIFDAVETAFAQIEEVQEDVLSMLKGGDLLSTLPVNSTFNVTAMKEEAALATGKGRSNAKKMIETYASTKKTMFLNEVGKAVADFWESTLNFDATDGADPLDIDWSVKKETKKAGDAFYTLASGFADDANVEDICTSAEFNAKKPILKKVCKGSSKPKCLDELMYLNEDTEPICEVANSKAIRKVRGRKFDDPKFLDYCNSTGEAADAEETPKGDCEMYFRENEQPWTYCKKVNDIRKGCRQITKFEKAQAKKALKAKKKAFNAAKKACYKACKKVDRSERKACKKVCKTDFHKSMLTNFTVPAPEATTE